MNSNNNKKTKKKIKKDVCEGNAELKRQMTSPSQAATWRSRGNPVYFFHLLKFWVKGIELCLHLDHMPHFCKDWLNLELLELTLEAKTQKDRIINDKLHHSY